MSAAEQVESPSPESSSSDSTSESNEGKATAQRGGLNLPKLAESDQSPVLMLVLRDLAAFSVLLAIFGGAKGRRTAIEGMVAIGVNSFVVNIPLKSAVRRKRPTDEVPEERRLAKPESYSFPSGHTASAAAFSGIVGRAYPKLWLPINGLAAMVGFSRVYTGVHFPGDVLGGWIVGKGVALVVNAIASRFGLAPSQVD